MTVHQGPATAPAHEVEEFKRAQRGTWAAGDYGAIATRIWDVGAHLIERLEIRPGEAVLDVACGTGNAAIPAARAGGRVVGADLTPELFDVARRLAIEAGVEVEWLEADVERLPFPDGSFDVVTSTFGCMFAPRHEVTAGELTRVLAPGGRIGLCNWTPEGTIGEFFATVAGHLPDPPSFAPPPVLWGDEAHVRRLFAGSGLELRLTREVVHLRFPSIEDAVQEYATKFGPIVKARELLEPGRRWPAMREALGELFARHNEADDGTLSYPAEYLMVLGHSER